MVPEPLDPLSVVTLLLAVVTPTDQSAISSEPEEDGSSLTYILVAVFVGVGVLLIAALLFYFIYWRRRKLTTLAVGMTSPYQRM